MAKTNRPDPSRNYVRYVGAHPEVAHPDAGYFRRNEATGPFEEEMIKLLTKDGESKEFERCAAPTASSTQSGTTTESGGLSETR